MARVILLTKDRVLKSHRLATGRSASTPAIGALVAASVRSSTSTAPLAGTSTCTWFTGCIASDGLLALHIAIFCLCLVYWAHSVSGDNDPSTSLDGPLSRRLLPFFSPRRLVYWAPRFPLFFNTFSGNRRPHIWLLEPYPQSYLPGVTLPILTIHPFLQSQVNPI